MSDLDELMSRLDSLDHTDPASWTDKSIDDVIALQRRYRAQREAGVKVKRGAPEAGPKKKLTLEALGMMVAKKADTNFKRRV